MGARIEVRRRGTAREDFALETIQLLKGRTRGPVFTPHRRPGPGKILAPRDVRPDTHLVCVSRLHESRHKKRENVRRCFKPSAEAIAEVTSLLAPGDSRR